MRRWRFKYVVVVSTTLVVLLLVLFKLVLGPNQSVVGMVVDGSIPAELCNCSCFQSDLRRLSDQNRSNHGNANETSSTHENNSNNKKTHQQIKLKYKAKPTSKAYVGQTNTAVKHVKGGKYLSEPNDPHTYTYIHNPAMTRFHENGTKTGIYLLFIVPTAPGNFPRRQAIRSSYGNASTWPIIDAAGTKTVFMLGMPTDNGVQKRIDKEAGYYGDVVQEDFVDSYLNLTRKTVMGLKWATSYCHHALYVMKIDDDTTVNQPRVVEIVKHAPRVNLSLGHVFMDPIVDRNTKHKFYISTKYYPADRFPSYINGVGYIMSADIVESVYHTAIALPLFPWEDVFVGMCLHKLNVGLRHDTKFIYWGTTRHIAQRKVKCPEENAIFTALSKDYVWQIFDACREQ